MAPYKVKNVQKTHSNLIKWPERIGLMEYLRSTYTTFFNRIRSLESITKSKYIPNHIFLESSYWINPHALWYTSYHVAVLFVVACSDICCCSKLQL